jgi:hypothetical protein
MSQKRLASTVQPKLQGQPKAVHFPGPEVGQPRLSNPRSFTGHFPRINKLQSGKQRKADRWSYFRSSALLLYHSLRNALVVELTMTQQN